MFSRGEAYFQQTLNGESRWWSWCIAFWFTIVGWVVAQNVIAGPIPEVIKDTSPELYESFNSAAAEMFSDPELVLRLAPLFFGVLGATILTVICWIVNRNTKETVQKVFGWATGIFAVLSIVFAAKLVPMMNDAELNAIFGEMMGANAMAYALFLLTFPAVLVGLFLVQKFIHHRTVTSLHTAASKVNWRRIVSAILITWVIYGTFTAVMHFTGISEVTYTFNSKRFLTFALVSLLLIPLQSGTEEIVFRGYLNQAFGHFIRNKWIVFIITSALFASMHLANPESVSGAEQGGFEHLLVMSSYFLFGFILCVVVYFEGGLEAAIGVHAANNMFAAIFVNYEGSVLPTPSLFLSKAPEGGDALWGILLLSLVMAALYVTRDKTPELEGP